MEVGRIVIAAPARRRGLATQAHGELIRQSRAAGQRRLVCEVDPRPAKAAFSALHRSLEFAAIGDAVPANGKHVRSKGKQR
ncbi:MULTISPECIES: acetyltransferase [Xanthomonas]|uniref:Acetyltransferase n=1 Tax=Xanthomonas phaseoli pv. dieffenbachiae TaxID=92828 RepID=A0A1V9H4Q5_9XANT|nr:acetyltransferase [Xanthomonas phaseoli]MBO9769265.1 acetyltransferase [Xanthomonas phaseoli pv. dieffenbachiae]MBO9776287.1 acetyltransferase [Xanthomonas phaseoli pv. dieffenbachiae]MBO9779172.1 acetyltransferase [Xanthomonas phaseoli pv. dieffenbachiae]MBO9787916.1 acetyltransferase [Xanthomonas phaseoli pv. dieffenbachiae]MBO9795715.1 acetyltransferase [Xanthomonas phaseoli pv. dieffenbachiae]